MKINTIVATRTKKTWTIELGSSVIAYCASLSQGGNT